MEYLVLFILYCSLLHSQLQLQFAIGKGSKKIAHQRNYGRGPFEYPNSIRRIPPQGLFGRRFEFARHTTDCLGERTAGDSSADKSPP